MTIVLMAEGGRVCATVDELLADATGLSPLGGDDGKSGASLFRCHIDGRPHVLKQTTLGQDWTMRVTGDDVFRPLLIWRRGVMHAAPDGIDHATVAMAFEDDTPAGPRLSILMHDVADRLVPEGDDPVPLDQHLGFVDHMAGLAAAFAGFDDDDQLTSLDQRVRFFSPENVAAELARSDHSPVIDVAATGWQVLPDRAGRLARLVQRLQSDPSPLVAGPGRHAADVPPRRLEDGQHRHP